MSELEYIYIAITNLNRCNIQEYLSEHFDQKHVKKLYNLCIIYKEKYNALDILEQYMLNKIDFDDISSIKEMINNSLLQEFKKIING